MSTRTRPSVIVSIDDPPLPTYPDYDNAITPTRKPGMPHSEKTEENNKKKMSKLLIQPKAGYNDPKNLQAIKYAQLIAAEYDDYYRKYTLVRSADPEMPGNFMIDGDSRTYPSGKKYEGGLFIFLDSDFPGTSGAWDSWASITGGEYDKNGKQYALSLDMSYYGYYGVRISGEYGDITYFNFKLDSYDNDICKLFDHNGYPTLWYNTLGPKVIYSSLKQLGTLYSLNVSGSSTLNSVACTQVNCSGNVFGQDLVGTNVWADYVESSGYVVANTVEATNWVGLPSMPVDPTDLLPITLDSANGYVGINNVTPTRALDVVGDMHVTGISALSDVLANTVSSTGDITGDVLVANTTVQAPEADITGTVFCDTINAQHYVNLPPSDVLPITLDKTNNRVGINTTNPAYDLDVTGNCNINGQLRVTSFDKQYVGNKNWADIASSDDGTKLAAVVSSGYIYTSTDSGVTWTARDSIRNWSSIASSSDGTKLAAVVSNGYIYTSTDSGVTWTPRDTVHNWRAITSSSDGTKLAAVVNGGYIYTSTDSGVTWTPRESVRGWNYIASSDDGTKLAAVVSNGYIYTSTDSGVTWTARDSIRNWSSIASSSDGTKLAAVVSNGYIYTSTDSGVTWTPRDTVRNWRAIASSSDGTKLAAVNQSGYIYTSTDSGVTWTSITPNINTLAQVYYDTATKKFVLFF